MVEIFSNIRPVKIVVEDLRLLGLIASNFIWFSISPLRLLEDDRPRKPLHNASFGEFLSGFWYFGRIDYRIQVLDTTATHELLCGLSDLNIFHLKWMIWNPKNILVAFWIYQLIRTTANQAQFHSYRAILGVLISWWILRIWK